ncbi:hypothetical protein ONS95_002216 [Cadophora gregata]|uniref:uncharacterized protein n=1 Tax=Cadophora gregata TaxID=51156 RepID=UPI0026DAF75E|nr:uncharacterized protein ONS95_002216 [Cadophora gregata]KAK0109528.1 hypothetical protein ONS95_002216 [Cadophora gregata]KAK0110846.1 hypothetical protein ONS96_002435 [Cadophora gregata f. sp. sojae]
MFSSSILSLVMAAGLASAAVVPRTLNPDEIIVYGEGRVEIMNKTAWESLQNGAMIGRPAAIHPDLVSGTGPVNSTASTLNKRCDSITVFTPNPVQTFLDWDVLMSSVIHATGDSATVSVTEGYSISNSVSVTAGLSAAIPETFLTASFGISYSETWSSTYSAAYTFGVPDGKYGAVVSNPWTTRHSGFVDSGCVGSASRAFYQADSYTSKASGGLSWVDGTISLCTGDEFPLKRCLGEGTL